MERNDDRLLTVWPETGGILNCSRAKAYAMTDGPNPILPTVRLGRSKRVPYRELMRWIADNTTGGQQAA